DDAAGRGRAAINRPASAAEGAPAGAMSRSASNRPASSTSARASAETARSASAADLSASGQRAGEAPYASTISPNRLNVISLRMVSNPYPASSRGAYLTCTEQVVLFPRQRDSQSAAGPRAEPFHGIGSIAENIRSHDIPRTLTMGH